MLLNKKLLKGLFITILVIVGIAIVLVIIEKTFFKHTPERLLKSRFGINLKDFDYVVEEFDEERLLNSDGHTLVVYKFNNLTQENIEYLKTFELKPLPIPEDEFKLMNYNLELNKYLEKNKVFIFTNY